MIVSLTVFLIVFLVIKKYNQPKEGGQLLTYLEVINSEPETLDKIGEFDVAIKKRPKNESELKAALRIFAKKNCTYNCMVNYVCSESGNKMIRGVYFYQPDDLRIFSGSFENNSDITIENNVLTPERKQDIIDHSTILKKIDRGRGFMNYHIYCSLPFTKEECLEFSRQFLASEECAGVVCFYDDASVADICDKYPLYGEEYVHLADHFVYQYNSNSDYVSQYMLIDNFYKEQGGKKIKNW